MPGVVIVGGGISGLALAFRLQQQAPSLDITVLEKQNRGGGTIATLACNGFLVEAGPNGFLGAKPTTLSLCRDLGMEDQLIPAHPEAGKNRYLFLDGRLRCLPSGLVEFLTSDLLTWRGKARFLMEFFRSRRNNLADESIAAFARRRAGPEIANLFADALVTGIFAGDPELLSMQSCFPRLTALEKEHGSVLKGLILGKPRQTGGNLPRKEAGGLWTLRRGLGSLIDTLCAKLKKPPLVNVRVQKILRQDNGWVVRSREGEGWRADAVVLACPAHEQAAILADLDPELAGAIGVIPYNRIAVVALGYRRADVPTSLSGFGYIAPQRSRRDVLGVQWCSSIFPERAPPDAFLLRAMVGGWHRAEAAARDDPELLQIVRDDLRQSLAITVSPIFHNIVRWDRAIPQYHLGHRERVAHIQQRAQRHPGLFLGGNSYHGVALNDCTEQGEILAGQVMMYCQNRQPPERPASAS